MNKYGHALLLSAFIIISGCVSSSGGTKEFYTDSYVKFENGSLRQEFSLKEMTANTGDALIIHVNATRLVQSVMMRNETGFERGMQPPNMTRNEAMPSLGEMPGMNRSDSNQTIGDPDNQIRSSLDFNIDELDVHTATPEGVTTDIQFVASKSGDFAYYSSYHGGASGILKIIDSGDKK